MKLHLYLGNRLNYACNVCKYSSDDNSCLNTIGILQWLENQNMKWYENNTMYIMFVIVTGYETS